jgi:hypothetical protein
LAVTHNLTTIIELLIKWQANIQVLTPNQRKSIKGLLPKLIDIDI